MWQQKCIFLLPTTRQTRDIISVVDNGPCHLWKATTNLLELRYLIRIRQSLQNIPRYRKTYPNEVPDVKFQDKSPAEGLPVFDNGTILPKLMGEPFINWIGTLAVLSIWCSLQLWLSNAFQVTGQAPPQDWFFARPKWPRSVPMQDVPRLFFYNPRSNACTSRDADYTCK